MIAPTPPSAAATHHSKKPATWLLRLIIAFLILFLGLFRILSFLEHHKLLLGTKNVRKKDPAKSSTSAEAAATVEEADGDELASRHTSAIARSQPNSTIGHSPDKLRTSITENAQTAELKRSNKAIEERDSKTNKVNAIAMDQPNSSATEQLSDTTLKSDGTATNKIEKTVPKSNKASVEERATEENKGTPAASSLSIERLPYGEKEDFLVGKTCVYKHKKRSHKRVRKRERGVDKYSFENPWICRDCSTGDGNGGGGTSCKIPERQGRCYPFPRMNPDETPRVFTSYNPFTRSKSAMNVYHHDGHTEYAKLYTQCTGTLSLPCFDLERCRSSGASPLKVYSYGGVVDGYLDYTTQQHPDLVQRVHNASEACLSVIGLHSFDNPDDLLHHEYWKETDGQNHYIFESANLFNSHIDRPFNDKLGFGMAATSPTGMDDAFNREGFDTPLGIYPGWKRPEGYDELDLHRPRRYLLSFKGNIFPWEQRSWQHRWIASEYWREEEDVHIDTKCESMPPYRAEYSYEEEDDYGQRILNSTFFFCPGGGSMNSFRFAEAMLGGAIPVVTNDFLPPFHPEIDWSPCVVRVSEARVVDVPRIVREISAKEVRTRRQICTKMVDAVFGSPPNRKQHFSIAMRLWSIRVKHALNRQDESNSIIPLTQQLLR